MLTAAQTWDQRPADAGVLQSVELGDVCKWWLTSVTAIATDGHTSILGRTMPDWRLAGGTDFYRAAGLDLGLCGRYSVESRHWWEFHG